MEKMIAQLQDQEDLDDLDRDAVDEWFLLFILNLQLINDTFSDADQWTMHTQTVKVLYTN